VIFIVETIKKENIKNATYSKAVVRYTVAADNGTTTLLLAFLRIFLRFLHFFHIIYDLRKIKY